MKIVALEREHEDCNRARVRVMPAVLPKAVVAVVLAVKAVVLEVVLEVVEASVGHARLLRCKSILMVWPNASSRFRVCRNVNTAIYRPVSMVRCFISKLAALAVVAVVADKVVSPVMTCSAIVSAIVAQRRSSAT